jgi:hypothetical protein
MEAGALMQKVGLRIFWDGFVCFWLSIGSITRGYLFLEYCKWLDTKRVTGLITVAIRVGPVVAITIDYGTSPSKA